MAKKYCKKSSMQAIATEVKTRKGSSSNIQGSNLATDISNLVIPAQRGAPTTTLTASNPSTTIQRGKHTGGSVSVVPQNATATIQSSGAYVPIENGKTLASVKVPATDRMSVAYGTTTPSSNATSITISGLSFSPVGIAIALTSFGSVSTTSPKFITGLFKKDGTVCGVSGTDSEFSAKYFGVFKNASMSFGTNSVTISNIIATLNTSNVSVNFHNKQHTYVVWG